MSQMDGRSAFTMTPWVRRLIAANAVVYLLTITVFTGSWFFQTFAFAPSTVLTQPWTLVTYAFLHGGFLHLAFNMLMLFFFGPAVEERLGGQAFLWYYLFCGLGGAVLSFAIALMAPVAPFVGASGAVFGVALAFALYWPDAPILVFPLPVPIKAKWLVLGLAAIDLALAVLPARDGIAHLAHLGGFLFGFLYLRWSSWAARVPRATALRRARTRSKGLPTGFEGGRRRDGSRRPVARPDETIQTQIDRLLDKISEKGIDSLTPDERQLLAERSRQLRQH
jgi:membrane associated rhomboid family serine protease